MALPSQDQVNAVARQIASAVGGAVLVFGLGSKISPETITAIVNAMGTLVNDSITLIGLLSPIVMAYLAYRKSSQTSQVQSVQAMRGVEQITVNASATPELAAMATDPSERKVVPTPAAAQAVALTAKEKERMKKLGKKPARLSTTLKFTDFFDPSKFPTPPDHFGHYAAVQEFHMLGNDMAGCCVWSGAAHQEYVWSLTGGNPRVRITTKDVLSDYAAATGYDGTDATDQGTDMQAGAEYWRTIGIRDAVNARHKIDSHVSLETGNWDQLVLATYLLGSCGVGLNLPKSAEAQFDDGNQPWTVVKGSRNDGGHYVPAVGRDINGNILVVTWGKIQPMTKDFYERYSDEARAYLSLEILDEKGLSPEGYNADALRKYITSLGG